MKKILYFIFLFCSILLVENSQAATVDVITTYSNAMNKEIKASVILPDSYTQNDNNPVLYLLHGYDGNYASLIGAIPVIKSLADQYEFIIVCPDGGRSWYFDSPVDASYKYETYISGELIPAIDTAYKTVKNRSGRAIAGISMGGHGAMYLALRHQDMFGAVGSICGGVDFRSFPDSWELKNRLGSKTEYPANWENNTVINMLSLLSGDNLKIVVDCGIQDEYFYDANERLHNELLNRNIPHIYKTRPGAHEYNYVGRAVVDQASFFYRFFNHLESEPAGFLAFNGTNQYMTIAHHPDFDFTNDESFSIFAWINTENTTYTQIVSTRQGGNGYDFAQQSNTLISDFANPYLRTQQKNSDLTSRQWHHVGLVYNGAAKTMKLYQNGAMVELNTTAAYHPQTAVSTQANTYGNYITVFAKAANKSITATSGFTKGKISALRFYNKALSVDEITNDLADRVTASTPNLIAAYDFSIRVKDGADVIVPDIKGKYHGVLRNFTNDVVTSDYAPVKIWGSTQHSAFTDLMRFNNAFYCAFREAPGHVSGGGKVRLMKSTNGVSWETVKLFEMEATAPLSSDLRDPKLSITADNRIMILMNGEFVEDGTVVSRRPYVSYSDTNGANFSDLIKSSVHYPTANGLSDANFWIWNVRKNKESKYGFDYINGKFVLFKSTDEGQTFRTHKVMNRTTLGNPSETDICFDKNDKMYAFIRRNGAGSTLETSKGYLGVSLPPYTDWDYTELDYRIEGQNVILWNDNTFLIGTRKFDTNNANPRMAVYATDLNGQIKKEITLTSGGDCSYPGMVIFDNKLWVSYYSSHEGKSNIYLSKIPLSDLTDDISTIGGKDIHEKSNILFYPNPVKDILYLNIVPDKVSLYSLNGQLITTEKGQITSLDISILSKGIYLLRMEKDNKAYNQKLIKE